MTTLHPPAAAEPRPAPPPARRDRRSWKGWGFIGPFVAVFALVFLAPIAYSIYLSLFRDQLIGGNTFVGLDNYQQALKDDLFWASLGRVALFLVVQVPIMLGIALLVASPWTADGSTARASSASRSSCRTRCPPWSPP